MVTFPAIMFVVIIVAAFSIEIVFMILIVAVAFLSLVLYHNGRHYIFSVLIFILCNCDYECQNYCHHFY